VRRETILSVGEKSPFHPLLLATRIAISERTKTGLIRARKAGKKLGRPEGSVSVVSKLADIERMQKEGLGLRTIARRLGCSVNTVQRVRALQSK